MVPDAPSSEDMIAENLKMAPNSDEEWGGIKSTDVFALKGCNFIPSAHLNLV
jgi:hypothetical protein